MDDIIAGNEFRIVSVKSFRIDADYAISFSVIKRRHISAPIKAQIKIGSEKLLFNQSVWHDLVKKGKRSCRATLMII